MSPLTLQLFPRQRTLLQSSLALPSSLLSTPEAVEEGTSPQGLPCVKLALSRISAPHQVIPHLGCRRRDEHPIALPRSVPFSFLCGNSLTKDAVFQLSLEHHQKGKSPSPQTAPMCSRNICPALSQRHFNCFPMQRDLQGHQDITSR